MIPEAYLIGAPKSGTTSVYNYLTQHPDVFVARCKEPGYWASDFPDKRQRAGYSKYSNYLSLYKNAGRRLCIDASTNYLRSQVAVKKIIEVMPTAKFIVILRDPLEVAQAYHQEQIFNGCEPEKSFQQAWRRSCGETRMDSGVGKGRFYLTDYKQLVMFGEQLERLFGIVPREQVYLTTSKCLFEQLQREIGAMFRFLDLDGGQRISYQRFNESKRSRVPAIHKFVYNPPSCISEIILLARRVYSAFPDVLKQSLTSMLTSKMPRDQIDSALAIQIIDALAEDREKLSRYLDVNKLEA